MTGFLGQKFDFTGEDGGWYSLIADANMHINMRVTSPVPDLPEITYITGTYDTRCNLRHHCHRQQLRSSSCASHRSSVCVSP